MTTAEEDFSAPGPNKDLRKHGKTVEFLMGVPETQSSRKVLIYQPTPRTTQSGTKVRFIYLIALKKDPSASTIDQKRTILKVPSFLRLSLPPNSTPKSI
jgi:hypothetical protein